VRPGGSEALNLEMSTTTGRKATAGVVLARTAAPPSTPEDAAPRPDLTPSSPTVTRVGGRPATRTVFTGQDGSAVAERLRWSPVAGLDAVLTTFQLGARDTLAIAEAVRFDRASRCATPVEVTARCHRAPLRSCRISPAGLSGSGSPRSR
jgi:hypothetical protein